MALKSRLRQPAAAIHRQQLLEPALQIQAPQGEALRLQEQRDCEVETLLPWNMTWLAGGWLSSGEFHGNLELGGNFMGFLDLFGDGHSRMLVDVHNDCVSRTQT